MTPEQSSTLTIYRNEYARFTGTNPTQFYKDELGSSSLKLIIQPIHEIITDRITKSNAVIDELPYETVSELTTFLKDINDYLIEIGRIDVNDLQQKVFQISQQLDERKNKMLGIWGKIAGIYSAKLQVNEVIGLKSQIDSSLKLELSKQEKRFLEAAENSNNNSRWWLAAVIFLIVVLLFVCGCFIRACWVDLSCIANKNTSDYQQKGLFIYELVRKSFLRILILSIIVYAIKFAVKNYNALKHNFVINRHKENSLDAALHLMNTLPTGVGRDAVINIASREIFVQHKTGYLSKDQDKIDISLLEQLLSIAKASKPDK